MAISIPVLTREQLLDRWRDIEEQEEFQADFSFDNGDSSSRFNRLRQQKEQWFSAAYKFMICQPQQHHVWCLSWDIMGPFLETFFNFFKVEDDDSPLKILWRKICEEMRRCTECVSRHHQAQEMYKAEYESSFISPLLDILQRLDEERVSQHLKELNARLKPGYHDPVRDNPEIVSLMFEVLTFPSLLEDEFVVNEFQHFIEAVDDAHELTLAKQQHFPGVYALLFFKSRKSRSIGHRLAGNMGRLRCTSDLEPLQPLLKRCIGFLAADEEQSSPEIPRPRVQMERMTVWLGLKSLLAFLEPQALEEGILEPYPVFLNFVLDHISDDSPEFSHAVNCMKLLFEILGCKLWLRTNLPPTVMRDSLLSQCFHTRNEKTHKEIFDLFHPLLQSLEALHDGEFEKQRRHLLYFLLHQVTRSSNFSMLIRKKACQIAFLIIHRGYKMNPPSPPTECAHMWGPSLVSSLKDLTLHTSLRQPAIDLIQTIIVSDATALLSSLFHCQSPSTVDCNILVDLIEEMDDAASWTVVDGEKTVCCWNEFTFQSNIVCQEYGEWMCVPMLWLAVLVEIEPSVLPISFSKAVVWAVSRFSMVEPENSSGLSLPVKTWLSSSSSGTEVSTCFGWKFPTGSNDGGDGVPSKNSIRVSTMCISLIRTFRRLAAHFVVQMEQGELRRQWTWEAQMGESLILLLSDPNDNVRQVGRRILEHISDTRGLSPGLQFLCCSGSSLASILSGLKHALKLVQLDSVLVNFQSLHHFFFVLCKIFKEGFTPTNHVPGSSSDGLNLKFASQGGFLRQPTTEYHVTEGKQLTWVEKKLWENFKFELAEVAWPSVKKCLHEGKTFIDYKISQMTCVRILELLPIVFGELSLSPDGLSRKSLKKIQLLSEFGWLHDLMDWGKSSLEAVIRYWKQSLTSLLTLVKSSCNEKSEAIITNVEKMILSNDIPMNSLMEQVSGLSVSLKPKGSPIDQSNLKLKPAVEVVDLTKSLALDLDSVAHDDADVRNLDTLRITRAIDKDSVILLSDEEMEASTSPTDAGDDVRLSEVSMVTPDRSVQHRFVAKKASEYKASKIASETVKTSEYKASNIASETVKTSDYKASNIASETVKTSDYKASKIASETVETRVASEGDTTSMSHRSGTTKHAATSSLFKRKDTRIRYKEIRSKSVPNEHKLSCDKVIAKKSSIEAVKIKQSVQTSKQTVAQSNDKILRDVVLNTEDPLEIALNSAGHNHLSLTNQLPSAPRRQVIQLSGPVDNRSALLRKLEAAARRFKPPKLDDWFRPILEMDYFAAMGLASPHEEENRIPCDLREVPVSFESPKQYVDIFRPLVLEEFKAQLHSSFQELSSLEEMTCGSLSVVSVERIDDFHLVRCVHDDRELSVSSSCMENDLVLLTKQPLKNSPHHVHMVGKVERRERDNKRRQNMLLIRFYLQSGHSHLNRARKLLLERSKWFLSRIMSITPQLRECQALSSIDVIPAISVILKPSYHSRASMEHRKADLGKLSQSMQQVLASQFNESQLQAISTVIGASKCGDNFELSLVQGPPGTGKTRTIVAIISAFLAVSLRSNAMDKQSTSNTKTDSSQFNSKARRSESAAIARAWQDAALARQLNNDMERDKKASSGSSRKRVLVCAQSNAAVDELVARLAGEGLYGVDGNMYKPYLVRVGNAKTIHPNSLPFFIDTLVEHRLAEEKMTAGNGRNELSEESSATLRENLEKIVDRIKYYESKRAYLKDGDSDKNCALEDEHLNRKLSNAELESRLRILYQQKKEIYLRLATLQSQEKKSHEETRALRNKLRRSILREAEIVITTLSGCGGDLYAACLESTSICKGPNIEQNLFDAVVIDEAAQALEPATLIPLQLLKSTGTKCIMVGDPKQLPATVLSNVASRYMYECSMFERLQRAGHPVIMLTKQYRMHPEISRFPSFHFYDGKLLDGVQLSSKTTAFHKTKGLGPYVFYDVMDGRELYGKNSGSSSLYNEGEADAAIEIVRFLQKRHPSEFTGGRIGIITPYKSQISLLRSRFSCVFGSSISSEMEFNTVDGFQGREVDILILSTVRSSDTSTIMPRKNFSGIGFVADVRRMNVALTRARLSLWILGNANTLQRNSDWAALIQDATERDLLISVKRPYKSMFDMIMGERSNFNKSKGYKGVDSGKNERSHHIKHTESNHVMNLKRKNKDISSSYSKETRDGHNESVASDSLPSAKRKMDVTDTCNDLAEQQQNLEDSCRSAKKSKKKGVKQCEQENDSAKKICKQFGSSGPEKQVQNPKGQECKSDSASHVHHKLLGTGTDEIQPPSKEVEKPKDLISKRKQQREAVDALLSSALVPSKKSETSSKAVSQRRRLPPSSNMGSNVRPTEQQKDLKFETQGSQKKDMSYRRNS